MPTYTVRIELHHAHSTDYSHLHEQMELKKFVRTIKNDSNGKDYHLPHGEYRISLSLLPAKGTLSAENVTRLHANTLATQAIAATIAASKKNGRVSYLKASFTTSEVTGMTILNDLSEA